ncbi:c-type cytochrome [Alienimonas californiensis]|uniref:Cytochrome c-552 n=1 Tax=Alienimonas californiensis TaxID=2527989 RepID=A0A517PA15_9PLAN|nr:c-type cytochrome [Alienimonas californiensis]QDT16217.1 Cytochrome c-552 precursor [Alienimonas californiensis]
MSPSLKRFLKPVVITAAGLGLLGAVLVVSGVVPVRASSGHWAITRWFLSFSMARSVSTDSLDVAVPATLDDRREILRGAGHYQTGCYPCHGNPTTPQPRVARAMLPHPPYLPDSLDQWEPEELFVIVKHGIKLAGMPAWPTKGREHRDDEVWAVVAFLRAYPELTEAEYRELVFGDPADGRAAVSAAGIERAFVQTCVRCHGVDGNGRGIGAFPRLAGQNREYLAEALRAYVSGERPSGIMEPIAAELTGAEIDALADYFAAQTPSRSAPAAALEPEAVVRGQRIALEGLPKQKVASCADCHGTNEAGQTGAQEAYPSLAGQPAAYLVTQLELFAERVREGTPRANLMHEIADKLTEEQRADVAAYYAAGAPAE